MEESSQKEKILTKINEDLRFKVKYITHWPYCLIGAISIAKQTVGTGILISGNIVLTSAALLTANSNEIEFIPAVDLNKKRIGSSFGIEKYPEKYVKTNSIDSNNIDYLGDRILMFFQIKQSFLELFFLYEKAINEEIWLVGCEVGIVKNVQKDCIGYAFETGKEQFGSPLLYFLNGEIFICGIHQGYRDNLNWGCLISQEILDVWEEIQLRYKKKHDENDILEKALIAAAEINVCNILSKEKLTKKEIDILISDAKKLENLIDFNLELENEKNFGDYNLEIISRVIVHLKQVKRLTFEFDNNKGLIYLSKAVKDLPNLENENINDEGFIFLSKVLEEKKKLETLKLFFNWSKTISNEGLKAISKTISDLPNLKNLSIGLGWNEKFNENGIIEFCDNILSHENINEEIFLNFYW